MANYGKRMVPEYLLELLKEINDKGITADDLLELKNKQLWYHGIDLTNNTTNSLQCHILNNSDTKINSITKFINWAVSITGRIVIQTNGCIVIDGVAYVVNVIIKEANNTFRIVYISATGYVVLNNVTLSNYFTSCSDEVNKIL